MDGWRFVVFFTKTEKRGNGEKWQRWNLYYEWCSVLIPDLAGLQLTKVFWKSKYVILNDLKRFAGMMIAGRCNLLTVTHRSSRRPAHMTAAWHVKKGCEKQRVALTPIRSGVLKRLPSASTGSNCACAAHYTNALSVRPPQQSQESPSDLARPPLFFNTWGRYSGWICINSSLASLFSKLANQTLNCSSIHDS